MTGQDYALIAGLVVILIIGLVALVVGVRRSASPQLPPDEASLPLPPDAASLPLPPDAASPFPGGAGADTGERDDPPLRTTTPTLERPEAAGTRFQRLKARLSRSGALGNTLLAILSRGDLREEDWAEIEETLLMADLGLGPTTELMDHLRTEAKVLGTSDPERIREVLRAELLRLVDPTMDRTLNVTQVTGDDGDDGERPPASILVVGVNGAGKTTTVGKLARVLVAEGHFVVLGAADTFRAAAVEQLATWGERVDVPVVKSDREGADPASVAFEAVRQAAADGADVVLVDTAGRLQNKAHLMDELGKIKRVMGRVAPVREVLLVLDATTGQNGLRQAQVFSEAVAVTGIVLTKLDGSAKGGIVVAVQRELGVPVKFVGLGEGPDDLAPFDPEGFVDAILSS